MKHRRGIDLTGHREEIEYLGFLQDAAETTFADIREWEWLGGHCARCEREGWVLRGELSAKWGASTYLGPLARRLRCLGCGNTESNRWIIGRLPR